MQKGKLMTTKELAAKIEKVKPYLVGHDTVGGVTTSGGEAMLQPEFVAALFMEAHVRGLTTCIDTTGGWGGAQCWAGVRPEMCPAAAWRACSWCMCVDGISWNERTATAGRGAGSAASCTALPQCACYHSTQS